MSSNAIARPDDTSTGLEVLPPARPAMSTARQVLMEHAELTDMAYQFARKLVGRQIVPLSLRGNAEEMTAVILYGAEIGLSPIAALQNVFAVHGTPGIYARTAQALLEAKGFRFKTMEDTDAACTVHGMRPGTVADWDHPDESSRFTIEDADRAGWIPQVLDSDKGGKVIRGVRYEVNERGKLVGNEKYLTQPRQMLWAKAMMEVCRRLSPATLLGIAYSVEELESEPPAPALSPSPAAGPGAVANTLTVEEILAATPDSPTNMAAEGKPKGHTSRMEAALAKSQAKASAPEPAPPAQDDVDTPPAPPAEPEPEPTPDPSAPEPTGDDDPPPPLDTGDAPDGDLDRQADVPPEPEPEPVPDDRPATKEQLQDLTQLIAAAGFQPTDAGRTQWFAFVSQTVGRDITANNQLTRYEIGLVGRELVMPAPSAPDSQP
ncbi:hypothetical protein [Mycobacterium sp. TY815]|uniref:hypothetical protein n=1 Tax=Mycobacterium sp. TY815 TaxID=3050581 RepID=UPI002741DEAB|nr:hypothetical protein [Mycobacterium sp. TY815]MDP7706830.1 hypothetical protein [Mycobacterium sp. TY815]